MGERVFLAVAYVQLNGHVAVAGNRQLIAEGPLLHVCRQLVPRAEVQADLPHADAARVVEQGVQARLCGRVLHECLCPVGMHAGYVAQVPYLGRSAVGKPSPPISERRHIGHVVGGVDGRNEQSHARLGGAREGLGGVALERQQMAVRVRKRCGCYGHLDRTVLLVVE